MERQQPIGLFDSGVGGLSIAHAIRQRYPEENIIYFADLKFSPYGVKSKNIINKRSDQIVDFLINEGCKAIVVACNTATVSSISRLRSKYSVPIVGVEPGIKPAALHSKTGRVGVLATERTLKSESFESLKLRCSTEATVISKACPDFIPLVEGLKHNTDQAFDVAQAYIRPLLLEGCDQIVLGCTHFSFLRSTIEKVVEGKATVIDTADSVALELGRRLGKADQLNSKGGRVKTQFWTSSDSETALKAISALWGDEVDLSEVGALT